MNGMSGLDDLYEDVVMDHYRNPRHAAPLEGAKAEGKLFNPLCGDETSVQADVEGGRLERIAVFGRGCAISQASGSMLAELVHGAEVEHAQRLSANVRRLLTGDALSEAELDELGDISVLEGVRKFPIRIKCALLPWTVLEEIIGKGSRP